MDKDINRIKVVLADKKRTNKWLSIVSKKTGAAKDFLSIFLFVPIILCIFAAAKRQ